MPITWQNVNAPSIAEASRALLAAQGSIAGAFDGVGKVLTDQRDVNQGVLDRQRLSDTVAFKEALANAKTPEQLAALQQSGQLEQIRAALDPKSRAELIGAEDARNAAVQQQVLQNQAFTDKQAEVAARPVLEQARLMAAHGDVAGAEAMLRELAAKGMPGVGELVQKAYVDKRAADKATADIALSTAQTADIPLARATADKNADSTRIQANASATQAQASVKNANTNEKQVFLQSLDRMERGLGETTARIAALDKGNAEAYDRIVKSISDQIPDKDNREKYMALVGQAVTSDPRFAHIPEARLQALVQQYASNVGTGLVGNVAKLIGSNKMDDTIVGLLKADMKKIVEGSDFADRRARTQNLRDELVNLRDRQAIALKDAQTIFDNAAKKAR